MVCVASCVCLEYGNRYSALVASCYLHRCLNLSRESGKLLLLVLEVEQLIKLKLLLFIIFNIKSKYL